MKRRYSERTKSPEAEKNQKKKSKTDKKKKVAP